MKYLGKNIKCIRSKWKLSQEEFGHLVSASRGMIMQYENRGTEPKPYVMAQIIKQTGINEDVLSNSELDEHVINSMSFKQKELIKTYRESRSDTDETISINNSSNYKYPEYKPPVRSLAEGNNEILKDKLIENLLDQVKDLKDQINKLKDNI